MPNTSEQEVLETGAQQKKPQSGANGSAASEGADPILHDDTDRPAPFITVGKFKGHSARDLLSGKAEDDVRHAIKGFLAEDQAAILLGPLKALKSSVGIDIGLSFASLAPALGHFPVVGGKRRVTVFASASEAGGGILRATIRRLCREKGITEADIQNWFDVSYEVPQIQNAGDVEKCIESVRVNGTEVAIFDNLVNMHSGKGAENAFTMVNDIKLLTDEIIKLKALPIVEQHTKTIREYRFLDLNDILYAGCGEHFRQWIMLSRRSAYKDNGFHPMYLRVGASNGLASRYLLDVYEGHPDMPADEKTWKVDIKRVELSDRVDDSATTAEDKAEAESKWIAHYVEAVRKEVKDKAEGLSNAELKRRIAPTKPHSTWKKVVAALANLDDFVAVEVENEGNGHQDKGFKLKE